MVKTYSNTHNPKSLEKLKNKEVECIYCGKRFKNQQALNWHLASCPKRALLQDFVFDDKVFHVWLNPRKDHLKALRRIEQEIKDPQIFIGAMKYLVLYGIVTEYKIETIKEGLKIKPPRKIKGEGVAES